MVTRICNLSQGDGFEMIGREYIVDRVGDREICFHILGNNKWGRRHSNWKNICVGAKSQQFVKLIDYGVIKKHRSEDLEEGIR
jgi:hypothetical protein